MKRVWSLILVCVLSVSLLCSCGGSKSGLGELVWPTSDIASQLPTPESKAGRVELEKENYLSVNVGDTSKDAYDSYVTQCKEKGFTVDYSGSENFYSAENGSGYRLSISYDDKSEIMDIMVTKTASDDSDTSSEPEVTESPDDSDDEVAEDDEDDEDDEEEYDDDEDDEDDDEDSDFSNSGLTGDEYEFEDFMCRDIDGKVEIAAYNGSDETVTIPSKVKGKKVVSIGESAFEGNTTMEDIIIWPTLKKVGARAFAGCTALNDISLSSKVTVVEESTFEGCTNLESVILWGSVKKFEKNCFKNCKSLEDISISSKCKLIGKSAFENCRELRDVIFWGGKEIGDKAFKNCTSLKDLSFPSKTEKIGSQAFYGCKKLKRAYCWNRDVDVASDAFDNCPKLKEHP